MSWLFNNQNVLLPSVYIRHELTPDQRVGLVQGRVKEAVRISNNLKHSPKVLSYWWYVYQDDTNTFLTEVSINLFRNLEYYTNQTQPHIETNPLSFLNYQ